MKVQKIKILSDLSYDLKDIKDYNSDVLIELENGQDCSMVVATQKNFLSLINNEKSNFLPLCDPLIFVKQFTKEII